jgi:type II secretory pathway pseudopilin PulG
MTAPGAPTPGRPPGKDPGEQGFALLEVLVALGVTAVVMASLAMFFVQSTTSVRKQTQTQHAAQLAVTSMEDVSQLPGSSILLGRTQQAVLSQWDRRLPAVDSTYVANPAASTEVELAWTDEAPARGMRVLPTTAEDITVNGAATMFQRHWYVGLCWQPRNGGNCTAVPVGQRPAMVPMYRVIIAIVWPSRDCPGATCQHVTAMLEERVTDDPMFS